MNSENQVHVTPLQLLDSGNFQTYNRAVAHALGSVNAAIMLSELINRYSYHFENGKLIKYQKYDGLWFYYTVEKCENRTALSKKEQESAIKILEKQGLFKKAAIGLPARRHFQLNEEAIGNFIQSSNNISSSPKKGQLGGPKGANWMGRKGPANKEPKEEPKEELRIKEVNEETLTPSKKKINNPRDFLSTDEEKKLYDRLVAYKPEIGDLLDPKAVSYWIKEYGVKKVNDALMVYRQQVDKSSASGLKVDMPRSMGAYIRSALDKGTKPSSELTDANKSYAKELEKIYPFVQAMEKYVKIVKGVVREELMYIMPNEVFKNSLNNKIELVQEYS